jgi:hypothetical protein
VWGAPPAGVGCHQNHLAERNSYGVFNKCAHGHQTAGRNRTHRLTWSRVVSMRGRPRFGRWRRGRLTKTDPAQAPHTRIRYPRGRLTKTPRGRLTPESAARAGASPNRAPRRRLSPKFRCLRGRLSPESAARAGVSYQTSSARAGASHQNPSPARAPYLKPRGPRCQLPAVLAGERLKRAHRCGPYSYSGLGAATTRYLTCRLQALPRNGRSALKVIYIKYLDNAASK